MKTLGSKRRHSIRITAQQVLLIAQIVNDWLDDHPNDSETITMIRETVMNLQEQLDQLDMDLIAEGTHVIA